MDERALTDLESKDQLRALERTRLRALVAGDLAVAGPLHAEEFQLVTPMGVALSKAEYLGAIADGSIDYRVFEPDGDIAVRLTKEMAVIRYRSRLEIVAAGHHSPLRQYWHTDHYEQRDRRWQMVWSQATAIHEDTAEENETGTTRSHRPSGPPTAKPARMRLSPRRE
jgi:hypothetical protein